MSTNEPRQGVIHIANIQGAVVTVGNNNTVTATIDFKKFNDSPDKSDPQLWKDIAMQMDELLKAVRALGDEHEELRDIELTPAVGSAKKEAAEIAADPQKQKESFIDKFKKICDLSGNVLEVGKKMAPFITTVAKLLGIAI